MTQQYSFDEICSWEPFLRRELDMQYCHETPDHQYCYPNLKEFIRAKRRYHAGFAADVFGQMDWYYDHSEFRAALIDLHDNTN